jgi:hypothetical protein
MLDDFGVLLRQPDRFYRTPQEPRSLSDGNGLDGQQLCTRLECAPNNNNYNVFRTKIGAWTFRKGKLPMESLHTLLLAASVNAGI